MDFIVKTIEYGSPEYEASIDLRNDLFRKPWGLDIRDEDLSSDKFMKMYGLYDKDKLIATTFIAHKEDKVCQIKSVAIAKSYQRKGLGKFMMQYAEDIAKSDGYEKVFIMGRVSAKDFYEKIGYITLSEPFDYHTIPHIYMEKNLI
ncbi:MAG: GNAT family N-acetyltransferase [Tissierellia bacterium]|nr:GNAT family N-acetyltransferase [Tissierellia bacterium]